MNLSVVMSVYNGEKFLRESIESILGQSFGNFEFIIIDDGSTDKSADIISSYQDSRIRYIKNVKNIGLTRSLNIGLKMAKGEFIARQDADDVSYADRFLKQIKFLESNPNIALVGTGADFIDSEGKIYASHIMPYDPDKIKNSLLTYTCFFHGSVIFRRKCLDSVGYYRDKFVCTQDLDYWLRFSESYNLSNISEVLYQFRRTRSAVSHKKLLLQLSLHFLAIQFSKERKDKGCDSYENLSGDIDEFLVKNYDIKQTEINNFKFNIILGYARGVMKNNRDIVELLELSRYIFAVGTYGQIRYYFKRFILYCLIVKPFRIFGMDLYSKVFSL